MCHEGHPCAIFLLVTACMGQIYDKTLKNKLQYTFSGPVCDVFKGGTHHGALGLSFRLTTLDTSSRLTIYDYVLLYPVSDPNRNAQRQTHHGVL